MSGCVYVLCVDGMYAIEMQPQHSGTGDNADCRAHTRSQHTVQVGGRGLQLANRML